MLMLEVIRGAHWRPKRDEAGSPVACETTREAVETLRGLIASGEACARARSGAHVELIACRSPDSVSVTILGRSRCNTLPLSEPVAPRYVNQGSIEGRRER